MLTQRKRQRTVEDFNQFCTFVLAYAGYIPYPKEEWWCNDGVPRDGSTNHSAWAYLSPPSADDGPPSQPDKGKRRKSDKTATGPREKTPKRCKSAKESPKTKTNVLSLSQALPENSGVSVRPREARANPEPTPSGAPQSQTGSMETRDLSGPREKSPAHLSTEGGACEEARGEADLTIGGLIENLLKTKCGAQGGGGPERKRRKEESERPWEEREEESVEGSRDSRTGNADVLRLVMDKRLKGVLPYDQETGYHTDMEGSDNEQDPHTVDCNTSTSSASDRDQSADPSKMEDDDSWDLITCFCLKPFAGRPMIECSECATWVHLSCAKIRRTHVPEVFVCQPCRDSKQSIRRSNRARIPPRKRFSD